MAATQVNSETSAGGPWKGSLFFIMDQHPGIRLAGDMVECPR